MALNDNTSTDQGATGTNIYVQALLNQGWRWDLAATVNAGRTIDYVLDGTWSQAEQMRFAPCSMPGNRSPT